jgi:hypothetical protein
MLRMGRGCHPRRWYLDRLNRLRHGQARIESSGGLSLNFRRLARLRVEFIQPLQTETSLSVQSFIEIGSGLSLMDNFSPSTGPCIVLV